MPGKVDRLGRRVRTGASDHRNTSFRRLDAELDHALVLVVTQGRRSTRRPDRHEAVRACPDLPIDAGLEAVLFDRAVVIMRDLRDYRTRATSTAALELRFTSL